MSWPELSRALASPITSMTMKGSMALRWAIGRSRPVAFGAGVSFMNMASRLLDASARVSVTVSPHSKANQAFGKDVARRGQPCLSPAPAEGVKTGIFARSSLSIYDQADPCPLWLHPDPTLPCGGSAQG